MNGAPALQGLRVVEVTGEPGAARLLGRLLVDLGAEVASFTGVPATADAWDTWVQAGKSTHRSTDTGALHDRLTVADVVVTDRPGHQRLHNRGGPRQPFEVCLSPFGLTGPLAGQPASELTLEALAGFLLANGNEGDAPRPTGVALGRATAALAGLVAVLGYGDTADTACVDIAELDTLVSYLGTLLPAVALTGANPRRIGNRHGMAAPWNVYRTADAPVVICTMGEPMWRRLTEVIGRPELAADSRFCDTAGRVENADALDAAIDAWSSRQASATLVQQLTAADIPVALLRTPAEVRRRSLTAERSLVTGTGAPHSPVASLTPRPVPGGAPRRVAPPPAGRPLAGLRVVELGAYTAAPLATRLLAELGADVVKVEPPHGEGARRLAQRLDDVGYLFFVNNAGKRGCRLDLADDADRRCFERLLATTDVVVTNLSAAALDAADLDAEAVLARHALVYCQLTGYGRSGAGAGLRAFDTAVQAESGVLLATPDAAAMKAAVSLADVAGAYLAAAATLLGVRTHKRTGAGQLLDVAMYDAAVWSTLDRWFADEAAREPPAETLLPTTDGTVAVSAPGQAELAAFVAGLEDSLDTSAVLGLAAAAGLAAAPVLGVRETSEHPQVTARGSVVRQTYRGTQVLITGALFHAGPDVPAVAPVLPTDVSWRDERP